MEINFIPFSRFLLIQRFVFSVGDDDDIDDDIDDDDDAAEADSEVSFYSTLLRTHDSPRLKSFGRIFFRDTGDTSEKSNQHRKGDNSSNNRNTCSCCTKCENVLNERRT